MSFDFTLVIKKYAFPFILTIVCVIGMSFGLIWLERANLDRYIQRTQSEILLKISTIRATIENTLNHQIFLTEAMGAYVSTTPDISQHEFENLSKILIDQKRGVTSIELARNGLVSHIYPFTPNTLELGIDILNDIERSKPALQSMRSRGTVLAGPIYLVHEGAIFIAFSPVYITPHGKAPSSGKYWGLVSIHIDRNYIFKKIGIFNRYPELRIAILKKKNAFTPNEVFLGDPAVFQENPVTMEVVLPGATWIIGATPLKGWPQTPPNVIEWRLSGMLLIFFIGILVWFSMCESVRLRHEIEERNRIEENLKQKNEILNNILSASPIGIGLVEERTFVWVNDEMRHMFGFDSEDDYRGKSTKIIYPSDKIYKEVGRVIYDKLKDGKPAHIDTLFVRKDGSEFFGHLKLSTPIPSNPMKRAVFTISDISWRKQLENEEIRKEKMETVLEMAGAICHELNQPMMVILGNSELLALDIPEDDPKYSKLEKIIGQIDRMKSITGKLANLTKYEAKEYISGTRIIDIHKASQKDKS